MLEISQEGDVLSIDVRPAFFAGLHPKEEILRTIQQASRSMVIELHLPHPGTPLIPTLNEMGLQVEVKQLASDHFCLMCTFKDQ